jgi:sarcosine oxidase subunit gamma
VVDVSANRIVFTMSGPGRNELLAAGCSIDLDPKVWRPRTCAQTLLAGVPVILGQGGAWTAVWVRPSFADYLIDWFLEHAAP